MSRMRRMRGVIGEGGSGPAGSGRQQAADPPREQPAEKPTDDRGDRGKRIVNEETRKEMRKILEEIRSGQFARDWILENRAGAAMFKSTRRREREHKLTETGRGLRKMMKWIDSKEV